MFTLHTLPLKQPARFVLASSGENCTPPLELWHNSRHLNRECLRGAAGRAWRNSSSCIRDSGTRTVCWPASRSGECRQAYDVASRASGADDARGCCGRGRCAHTRGSYRDTAMPTPHQPWPEHRSRPLAEPTPSADTIKTRDRWRHLSLPNEVTPWKRCLGTVTDEERQRVTASNIPAWLLKRNAFSLPC